MVHFHISKMKIGYSTESKQIDVPLKVILNIMTNEMIISKQLSSHNSFITLMNVVSNHGQIKHL